MSEVFEGYERQYCEISASLSRKCAAASALDGEKKKEKLSEIQADVQESESLVKTDATQSSMRRTSLTTLNFSRAEQTPHLL
nr:vesicle transport v-SNARE 11-like [Lolium perenne]